MEDRRQFGMKLSVDLIARVDKARGPMSRTGFVEQALEAALAGPDKHSPGQPVAPRPSSGSTISRLPTMAQVKEMRRTGGPR